MIKELKWESEIFEKNIADFRFEKLQNNKKELDEFLIVHKTDMIQSCVEIDNKEGIEFWKITDFIFKT